MTVERCTDCGLVLAQDHYACEGHQFCYPECPRCGGDLEDAEIEDMSLEDEETFDALREAEER